MRTSHISANYLSDALQLEIMTAFPRCIRLLVNCFLLHQCRISLVMKSAVTDPEARRKNFVTRKFRNEDAFYGHIRNRLLMERGPEESLTAVEVRNRRRLARNPLFPRIPRVYGSGLMEGDEFILLEDLVDYSPHPDPQNLDAKHLKASIQALAAFHSASVSWRSSNPNEYSAVAHLFCETEMMRPNDIDPPTVIKTQKMNIALVAAIRDCSALLAGDMLIRLEKVSHSAIIEAPHWVRIANKEPWNIITHGDCWAKNFLYKYNKNKKITGIAMVDFKSARAASPILDVTNFLLSSASPECLKDLLPFLKKHRTSLSPRFLHRQYRHHLQQYGTYGLVSALINHYSTLNFNWDSTELRRLFESNSNLELIEPEASEMELKSAASPGTAGTSGKERDSRSEKRVALVVKAAHDFKII